MGKKVITEGAPAYMAQYTALMTILLAFFILLNTLTEEQEAGFNAGIGDIRNAFGITGGLGLFQFSFAGRGAANPAAPIHTKAEQEKDTGFDKSLLTSEGGPGNTDVEFDEKKPGEYLRIPIRHAFPASSDRISPKMAEFLRKIGMGIELFNYNISIRCFATELGNETDNAALASKRAARIMRYLNETSRISYDRMVASGTGSPRYFEIDVVRENGDKSNDKDKDQVAEDRTKEPMDDQGIYFYVFLKQAKPPKSD